MISVSNLAKSYGAHLLFERMSLQLNPGNRYGIVGANGSGKSTLLRILSGEEEPSAGTVTVLRQLRIGTLRQDHFRYERKRILDVVMMGNRELWQALAEREALLARAEKSFDAEAYARLEDIIARHDGYSQQARAGEILEGLGIASESHSKTLSTLSGGFKLRVLLAQILASSPDALLLDEPTNHLDILSIRWLEKFLCGFRGLVVVVSHDHRFLDNVCTHVVDIDYATATLYKGNYSRFCAAKVEQRERKEAEIQKRQKQIAEQQAFVDRFRAKASKARQAQSKLKLIERMELEPLPPSSRRYPAFRFQQRRPSGKKVLALDGVCKSFGSKSVLSAVSLEVMRGDRLAVIGPNGIGKSTLLKLIAGELAKDAGSIEWGHEAHWAYLAQDFGPAFDSKVTVENWLWQFCSGEPLGFVRSKLGLVLFSGDEAKKPVGALSGGEMARLSFCRIGVEKPNVLLLDEPTNHLDLEAIEALTSGLREFVGTLVFVSHDRWFVSELASRILELTPDGLRDFRGTYTEYLERLGDDHLDAEVASLAVKRVKNKAELKERSVLSQKPKALSCAELERQRDNVTRDLALAEAHMEKLDQRLCNPELFARGPSDDAKRLMEERDQLRVRIAALMQAWESAEQALEGPGNLPRD